MIGRLLCWWKGHKRGVRVATHAGKIEYRCPRCSATWERKSKTPH